MSIKEIFEPLKMYNENLKDSFEKNCEDYFDDLVKQTNINISENRKYVKKFNKESDNYHKLEKKICIKEKLYILFISLIVLSILSVISLFINIYETTTIIKVIVICVAVVIVGLSIFGIVKNKIALSLSSNKKDESKKQLDSYKNTCNEIMNPLNIEFDWSTTAKIIKKTAPFIELDDNFDFKKYDYLKNNYGFKENNNINSSTNYVISGDICGNPFMIVNSYNTELYNVTYTGELSISWDTIERNQKGEEYTKHHFQILRASVTKPKPKYFYDTNLIYANEACPKLSFSRTSVLGHWGHTNKEIDKIVKKGEKRLRKDTKFAVEYGKSYNAMANSKFEVLFNANDRNNEVDFRLLFTPLAQKNIIDLLINSPFRDDFSFEKYGYLNYIHSDHSQKFDYYIHPYQFCDYDIDNARKNFISLNNNFFKNLYFDLAPLISIPLYQQIKSEEYIYKKSYIASTTKYEQESIAYNLSKKIINPKDADTDTILKCKFNFKSNNIDTITITAYSYKAIEKISYFKIEGNDGYIHTVEVPWIDYIPVIKETKMQITKFNTTRKQFNNSDNVIDNLYDLGILRYERGLLAFIPDGKHNLEDLIKRINATE